MKKILSICAVILLIATLFPLSAAAHGHGSGSNNSSGSSVHHSYADCSMEDCSATTAHRHGKIWYGGHTADDGHSHHVLCSVNGCTRTAVHEHDGVICFPQDTAAKSQSNHTRCRSIGRHH